MTKELKKIPTGINNFKELITENYYYVDKTLFIKELLDVGSKVTLIPRPRRFGKTLNMSMLNCFFAKQLPGDQQKNSTIYQENSPNTQRHESSGTRHLFDNLEISKHPEIMKHQGQYPVIFMTFKFIEGTHWNECFESLKKNIAEEYRKHEYLLHSAALDGTQKNDYRAIINKTASLVDYQTSLKELIQHLKKYHGKEPIVLIDEYDVPINKGYHRGYYNEVVEFIRLFFGDGLKDNDYLKFAVITGALRIARESIFTGFNHLVVFTFLESHYADKFGFLPQEVETLIRYYGHEDKLADIQNWYNGYQSGNHKIYNPWSILNFVVHDGNLGIYWINTSDNKFISDIIKKRDENIKADLRLLIERKTITKEIDVHISFAETLTNETSLWGFLVLGGYLTFCNRQMVNKKIYFDLSLPNDEVAFFYEKMILSWFKNDEAGHAYNELLESLISGNIIKFKRLFEAFALNSLSYFDIGGNEPERFYHAFVLGLLVELRHEYDIKSNRESGTGRYDVMITPHDKNKLGIILEFKKVDIDLKERETLESAADKALAQITEKKYAADMRARGVLKVVEIGIAFQGKEVLVKGIEA